MDKTFQQMNPDVVEQILAEVEMAAVLVNKLPDGYIKANLVQRLANIDSLVVNSRPAKNIVEAMQRVAEAG